MFNSISQYGTTSQNHNEIPLHANGDGYKKKEQKLISTSKGVEKLKPSDSNVYGKLNTLTPMCMGT